MMMRWSGVLFGIDVMLRRTIVMVRSGLVTIRIDLVMSGNSIVLRNAAVMLWSDSVVVVLQCNRMVVRSMILLSNVLISRVVL